MIRINLLPFRAARKKENVRQQVSIFVLSVVLAVIALVYYNMQLSGRIHTLQDQVKDTEEQITKYKKITKEIEEIKKKVAMLHTKIAIIGDLEKNRNNAIELLDALTRLVVEKRMWLTNLEAGKDRVVMRGIALDNKTVADFMTRLEESQRPDQTRLFSSVNLQKLQKEVFQQNLALKRFDITCTPHTPPAAGAQTAQASAANQSTKAKKK